MTHYPKISRIRNKTCRENRVGLCEKTVMHGMTYADLKRARYDVELAERTYQAVDPDNRLVTASLERRREQALQRKRELKEEYDRFRTQTHLGLSADEVARIEALSTNDSSLWHAPQTTNAERQSSIRCVVERVVVYVDRNSEQAEAVIQWAGDNELGRIRTAGSHLPSTS